VGFDLLLPGPDFDLSPGPDFGLSPEAGFGLSPEADFGFDQALGLKNRRMRTLIKT
jgi:hypothetical protein